MTGEPAPAAPVWVLDERGGGEGGQALALAGRLGLPFLRLPVARGDGVGSDRLAAAIAAAQAGGAAPALVISAGWRSGLQALALRARLGARLLHCSPRAHALMPFDLMVRPGSETRPASPRIIPALGPIGVVSPALLREARALWRERLDHLPHPRVALIVRAAAGPLDPGAVHRLAQRLAGTVAARGGSVLASVDVRAGQAAVAALVAALRPATHLLYRTNEPGEDPTLGFLSHADSVVVGGASPTGLTEAAAASVPLFADPLGDRSADGLRLLRSLASGGELRVLGAAGHPLAAGEWRRRPLDEAGRVAGVLRGLLGA